MSQDVDGSDRLGEIDAQYEGDDLVFVWSGRGTAERSVEVVRFDTVTHLLRIFPKTWRSTSGYQDQFRRITELQLEEFDLDPEDHSGFSERFGLAMLNGLPRGFGAVYAYGLGIRPEYRGLLHSIEEHSSCTVVRFVGPGQIEERRGDVYCLALSRFEAYRQAVDRNKGRAQTALGRVIDSERHNAVADLFGLQEVEPKYAKSEVINSLTEEISTGHVMTEEDRVALVDRARVEAPKAARESPEQFGRLRRDVELASLEALIETFERGMVGAAARDESYWQDFFHTNPFALQQVFGAPIVEVLEQAEVRGAGAARKGARITDFLCKNAVTRTAVVVEIKTPAATLMEPKPYRAVFAPHREDLAGAVAQLQAQMESVTRHLARKEPDPDLGDLDLWHTSGAVIVGRVGDLDGEQRESFLRYREGLAGAIVLGYDEVCERLKGLLELLRDAPPTSLGPSEVLEVS